jgi:hypothetical protein
VHPPPPDRALLWFDVRSEQVPVAIRLRAADWSGHAVGSLAVPCQQPCWFKASPDGQRLLVGEYPPEGRSPSDPDTVFDSSGRRVGTVEHGAATWADDSRHLCVLRGLEQQTPPPPTSRAELDLVDPAAAATRTVGAVVGMNGAYVHESLGIGSWNAQACSVISDRAVLSFDGEDGVHNVRVMQLSTGRILYSRDDLPASGVCGCQVERMTVNHDSTVAVESLTQGPARLRDLTGGAIAPLPAAAAVRGPVTGISWNGHRFVTGDRVVDLATGRTLWVTAAPTSLVAARPASDDVLMLVQGSTNSDYRPLIVRGDGSVVALPAGYS